MPVRGHDMDINLINKFHAGTAIGVIVVEDGLKEGIAPDIKEILGDIAVATQDCLYDCLINIFHIANKSGESQKHTFTIRPQKYIIRLVSGSVGDICQLRKGEVNGDLLIRQHECVSQSQISFAYKIYNLAHARRLDGFLKIPLNGIEFQIVKPIV